MKHSSSCHCCCQASLSAVSADEHMSEARAMRLENKWIEVRSHAQMALLTPNSPEVVHEAYLFLAEADFHMSRFAAAKEHLAWYLSEKPTCPNGLQLKADLEGHEVEGDEDSGDDKEQHLPMSHEAAEAAAQEIMDMPPVLEAATERAEAVGSVEAPLHGGQRSCMISVSVPISSTLKALLEKHEVSREADAVTFHFNNGKVMQAALKTVEAVQPAGTVAKVVSQRTSRPEHLRKELQIPKKAFARLIKDMISDLDLDSSFKFHQQALECLQEATEVFLSELFSRCVLVAQHAKRKTVFVADMTLVLHVQARV